VAARSKYANGVTYSSGIDLIVLNAKERELSLDEISNYKAAQMQLLQNRRFGDFELFAREDQKRS
jgi:hypothetical protein